MESITGWLLLGVLLLPTLGAVAARLLGRRYGSHTIMAAGALGVAGAVACLVALRFSPERNESLGQFSIFLPSSAVVVARDSFVTVPTAAPVVVEARPTATPRSTPTPRPTIEPTATPTPTEAPTPTVEPTPPPTEAPPPTLEPTPAPTEAPPPPTEAPPPPTEAPPRQTAQRYIVESGDTLRSIAARFDVSVEALLRYNGLTPDEGDSLGVGQELFIPPE